MNKEQFKELITSNINQFGYHFTYVIQGITPRYVYTIGLIKKIGFEIIFAGGNYYNKDIVNNIITDIASELIKGKGENFDPVSLENIGTFSLSPVDTSWSKLLMLGVYDYYNLENVIAYQICPDKNHLTLDTPDMAQIFDISTAPVWLMFKT